MKYFSWLVITVFILILPAPLFVPGAEAQETFNWEDLVVVTKAGGRHPFRVEIADTPSKHSQGLQGRESLSPGAGMLFDFKSPQSVFFWMKNTLVPLDMIFIGANGLIINIARQTTPLSLAVIPSAEPARAVLEILGGQAGRLGIVKGDRVAHRIFE
jgi:uncharacterized membrane protein (UPF0127 family)